jgi:hypothetical protein
MKPGRHNHGQTALRADGKTELRYPAADKPA